MIVRSTLTALCALSCGSVVRAGEPGAPPADGSMAMAIVSTTSQVTVQTSAQPAARPSLFGSARSVDDGALDQATAREDLSLVAQSQQAASVSNNSVNGTSRTGEVTISDNAFQNASGLTVLNANTGNNVAMSGSINVNVTIVSGPR